MIGILLALVLIAGWLGLAVGCLYAAWSILRGENKESMDYAFGAGAVLCGLFLVLAPLAAIAGDLKLDPELKDGACYRVAGKDSTSFVPVGKTIVPITTHGHTFVEVQCP